MAVGKPGSGTHSRRMKGHFRTSPVVEEYRTRPRFPHAHRRFQSFSGPGTSLSLFANGGKSRIQRATTTNVPTPPRITEPIGPSHAAVAPARNSPSWLLVLLKVALTAET